MGEVFVLSVGCLVFCYDVRGLLDNDCDFFCESWLCIL